MATSTTIPPPPDPENLVPDVKRTGAERIGGFLGAISGGGALGSISDALERHHQKRLAEAKMYHDVMVEKLSHPAYADEKDPEHQRTVDAYNAAKQAYMKSAGVDKETKQQIQQRTAIAEHHIGSQGQPQPPGGAQRPGGIPPPPTPGTDFSGPEGGPAGQSNTIPPPPKPDMMDIMAGVPAERQADADKRVIRMEQAKQDILTAGKVAEEKAKPPSGAAAKQPTPMQDAYFSLLDTTNPKTGVNYTPDEALRKVTDDSTKKGRPTPFEEYMSDPTNFAKFQAEMAKAKSVPGKNASIGAVYGIYRMMEMGYKQNPEILPVVAQLAPQVFKNAGMEIPPAMAAALGKIPQDQPLSPTTGQPIGTSMPGAPTSPTRTAAQTAARVAPIITDLRGQINDLKQYLGPEQGRINVKYLLGKVGSTGDPAKDRALSGLRTNLELLTSLTAKFHISSVRAMQEFAKLADAGKDSAPALIGFLDQVEKRAKETEQQEKGFGEIPPPPSPKGSDPLGIR